VIVSYIPYGGPHGLATRVEGICTTVLHRGSKCSVICPGDVDNVIETSEAYVHNVAIPFFRIGWFYGGRFRVLVHLLFQLKAFALILLLSRQFHLKIQIQQILQLPLIFLLKLTRFKPVVIDDLNLLHPDYDFLPKPVLKLVDIVCINFGDLISTASHSTLNYMKPLFPNKTILFAPNGIETRDRITRATKDYAKLKMVFIGSFGFRQNMIAVKNILEDADYLYKKKCRFSIDIVGGPLDAAKQFLKIDVVLKNLVTFHGFVQDREMQAILDRNSIGLLPFFEDTPLVGGQRTKALQYMANELLVLSGPEGVGRMNHIEPGIHYLEERTKGNFRKRLVDLSKNYQKYESIANSGRIAVEENYSWNETMKELVDHLVE